jgi:hypothetical protein
MSDRVECRSDFEYAQRPVAFYWQGERLSVAEILSQSRQPAGYSFRVLNEELGVFELDYDIHTDQWSVQQL